MSGEKKQRLKEYQKYYRDSKKSQHKYCVLLLFKTYY